MLYLHGIGHFHPETIVHNKFLVDLDMGIDEEWILQRVGIRERRTVLDLDYIRRTRNSDVRAAHEASSHSNAQTGRIAAEMALSRAELKASDIGMVVGGGSSAQNILPAEACLIAAELGIEGPCFDVNSACATAAVQLSLLSRLITTEGPDFVLVVNPENVTRTVDFNDRTTCLVFGDASSAMVVSGRVPSRAVIRCQPPQSAPRECTKIVSPNQGHLRLEGQSVQAFAIRTMSKLVCGLKTEGDRPESTFFIGHQANSLALETVRKRAGILERNHLFNVDWFGNCAAAGAPSVLSQNWEKFTPGQSVLVAVVGGGLTWGSFRVDFCQPAVNGYDCHQR
jgi:3-oxoacyl-[acyl-carrier-protein] synthase III